MGCWFRRHSFQRENRYRWIRRYVYFYASCLRPWRIHTKKKMKLSFSYIWYNVWEFYKQDSIIQTYNPWHSILTWFSVIVVMAFSICLFFKRKQENQNSFREIIKFWYLNSRNCLLENLSFRENFLPEPFKCRVFHCSRSNEHVQYSGQHH